MRSARQYCTFSVSGDYFGVDVLGVQEMMRHQEMTRVPLAPPAVRGLINLRGQIVTAIDLRRRLGMPDRADDEPDVHIVLRTDDGAVSLLVDAIGDVLEVPDAAFEPPPQTLRAAARPLIRGVYKLKDRLLLLLDIDKIVTPEADEPAPAERAPLPASQNAGLLENSL